MTFKPEVLSYDEIFVGLDDEALIDQQLLVFAHGHEVPGQSPRGRPAGNLALAVEGAPVAGTVETRPGLIDGAPEVGANGRNAANGIAATDDENTFIGDEGGGPVKIIVQPASLETLVRLVEHVGDKEA